MWETLQNAYNNDWTPVVYAFFWFVPIVFIIAVLQNREHTPHIRSYRKTEEILIKAGKMDVRDLVVYHQNYGWSNYAALAFAAALVIIAADWSAYDGTAEGVILLIALALLSTAAIIMACVDVLHTNTLSPLVPDRRRFVIINFCILTGGLGILLNILAVSVFISIFSNTASYVATTTLFIMVLIVTRIRRLPRDQVEAQFGLEDGALSPENLLAVERENDLKDQNV